jgi:hypothetical protein
MFLRLIQILLDQIIYIYSYPLLFYENSVLVPSQSRILLFSDELAVNALHSNPLLYSPSSFVFKWN